VPGHAQPRGTIDVSASIDPAVERILVVKLADIGDVLTATPALRALRESYPRARIDALVTPGSARVLAGLPSVDRVIPFDKFQFDNPLGALRPAALAGALGMLRGLRASHYDAVIVLHHLTLAFGRLKYAALVLATGARLRAGLDNGHGWFYNRRATDSGFGARHEVEYALEVVATLGAGAEDVCLQVGLDPSAEAWAEELAGRLREEASAGAFAILHPGSGGYSLARRWAPERFASVAGSLHTRRGLGIVLVGQPGDGVEEVLRTYRGPATDLTGRTDLGQLAALLRRSALFVGADSGVMHLAAAAGTPMVAIFGPTNQSAWGPWTAGWAPAAIVSAGEACQPCAYVGYRVGRREGCPERHCMERITP